MSTLEDLPNIGSILAQELTSIGIETYEDLLKRGSLETFISLIGKNGFGCYNKLYALEGAIQKIRWHNLSKIDKDNLKKQYEEYLSQ